MNKVQKIREEVERLQKRAEYNFGISLTENERQFWLGESNVLTSIGKYIDTMQEEPVNNGLDLGCGVIWKDEEHVSEELEEAIEQSFIYHENRGDDFRCDEQIETSYRCGFETGADWKEQQLMAKAFDGEVGYWNLRGLSINTDLPRSVSEGDKVKIIVIKEG